MEFAAPWPSALGSDWSSDVHSGIYEGHVRHRRFAPVPHEFRYALCMMYVDLDELPTLFEGKLLWSARRPAVARFRRKDYLGDPTIDLRDATRRVVEDRLGRRPTGPIRLLTHPAYLGYCFNPVSFYYCFRPDGRTLDAIIAEITNTPWSERHQYVLDAGSPEALDGRMRFRLEKAFHISPFMGMSLRYDWRFSHPGDALAVHMENLDGENRLFDATMTLRRREITSVNLDRVIQRYPLMTLRVIAAIHTQALRLWLKRLPVYSHPRHRQDARNRTDERNTPDRRSNRESDDGRQLA